MVTLKAIPEPALTYEFQADIARSRIKILLFERFVASAAKCHHKLTVHLTPSLKLVAKQAIKANELQLVPMSTSISLVQEGQSNASAANDVPCGDIFVHPGTWKTVRAYLHGKTALPKASGQVDQVEATCDNIVVPFWLVPRTNDGYRGNMEIEMVAAPATKSCTQQWIKTLSTPVLTNPKALKSGDELLWYKSAKVLPDAKRAKLS